MNSAILRAKRLFQILVLLALLCSPFGSYSQVSAGIDENRRAALTDDPHFIVTVNPSSLNIGTAAMATVSLQGLPAQGYSSAEFTCTYDANAVQVSYILAGALFGEDPAVAIHGQQDGQFVFAIAGSQGRKATASGTVFVFTVLALQPGQTSIDCTARVSTGDDLLTEIPSTPASLTITGATPTATVEPRLCDHVQFIADVSVPDGTVFAPGQSFTKTWRLKNIGSCRWTPAYRLVFMSGDLMGGPASANFTTNVEPGTTVNVSIPLTAPSVPGSYRGYWMFQNANGALFGMGAQANKPWWLDIRVAGPSSTPGGPTFTPSATITPTIAPVACDKAEFIADVTVPPGTAMSPGAAFKKTWRFKNVGTCTWTSSYRIAFLSGEQMGALSSMQLPVHVTPGEMVDLSLDMTAPPSPGIYRGDWIFQNATGSSFGIGPLGNEPWSVDIVVPGSTVTPSPTLTSTPGAPTQSPTPSLTPGAAPVTPIPNVVYDFVANMCTAVWSSNAGGLPCPGIDGNANGFVFNVPSPQLETGIIDPRPALLMSPQNVQSGYIQGVYPHFRVQSGDRFRALLSCEFGATSCYGAFRLDYQVGSDPVKTFWGPFVEAYDGWVYIVDTNLSALAGKDVKFILTVLSAGAATGDRMMWVGPVIYRPGTGSTTPIVSQTVTPNGSATPTSTAVPGGMLNGQVVAARPVTITVYDEANSLVTTSTVNVDGSFTLPISPGVYSVLATAPGFLSAQTTVTITNGGTTTLPSIHLLPGDIDNNDTIDPLDALTIGMNYNLTAPTAADLNDDGIINVLDLELLAKNYRRTGPVPWQ